MTTRNDVGDGANAEYVGAGVVRCKSRCLKDGEFCRAENIHLVHLHPVGDSGKFHTWDSTK